MRGQAICARALVVGACCSRACNADPATFLSLDDLPGGATRSAAFAVSDDGTVVVGEGTSSAGLEAFRWSAATGMIALADLPGGTISASARAISADGRWIVGHSESQLGTEACRWNPSLVPEGLGDLAGGSFFSDAYGVSSDGATVVGLGNTSFGAVGFRWVQGTGMTDYLLPPTVTRITIANAVSADATLCIGESLAAGIVHASIWTPAAGATSLPQLPGTGTISSSALAMNRAGTVIVGYSTTTGGVPHAVKWSGPPWGQPLDLGDPGPGTTIAQASAVSSDGSIVVGTITNSAGTHAFVWTAPDGLRDLATVLTAQGANLVGWTLLDARGLSADGRVIVGRARNSLQQSLAFRATLPAAAPACPADVDNGTGTGTPDGGITIDDLLFFLAVFDIGDIRADLDDGSGLGHPDGGVTIDDLLFFLFHFDQGC